MSTNSQSFLVHVPEERLNFQQAALLCIVYQFVGGCKKKDIRAFAGGPTADGLGAYGWCFNGSGSNDREEVPATGSSCKYLVSSILEVISRTSGTT